MQTEIINKRFTEVQSALVFKKKKEETKNENKKSSIQVNIDVVFIRFKK